MWQDNQLTKQLEVTYPIIQAGMAGSTTPQLVASVSNSGGLGTIGAGYFSSDKLDEEITHVKQLTSKPFAVNLFVPSNHDCSSEQIEHMNAWLSPYRRALNLEEPVVDISETEQFNHNIDIVIKHNVPVCSFTFGIPHASIIKKLKEHHIKLIGTATSVEEAIKNEQAGMDIVIAQGSEAGGHRGSFLNKDNEPLIGTMSLVPQVVDELSIPVVAAGGIMDDRGVLASLVLGASGVQMGTAFLTSTESNATPLLKNAIFNSKETDTVMTKAFSGKLARGINNRFIEEMSRFEGDIPDYPIQNQLTNNIRKTAAKKGDASLTHLWSGQSPRLAQNEHASTLIANIVQRIDDKLSHKSFN